MPKGIHDTEGRVLTWWTGHDGKLCGHSYRIGDAIRETDWNAVDEVKRDRLLRTRHVRWMRPDAIERVRAHRRHQQTQSSARANALKEASCR